MAGGKAAVLFASNAFYVGPPSVAGIEGSSDRTIEVRAFNPTITPEESMVTWSDRMDQTGNGGMMSFNYGNNTSWGAVIHWNIADMPWGPAVTDSPTAGQWHHLVYTYDGADAHVFADGIQKNQKNINLETRAGFSINLAAQRDGAGFTLHAGLAMAIIRVHDGELSAGEIKSNYDNELPRFQ